MTREIVSREIEFRAWLKNDKVMTGKVLQITDNPSVQYIKFDKIENWKGNHLNNPTFADLRDVVLMQYTGFKDKNGKKIFEGDIVYISGLGNVEIEDIRKDYDILLNAIVENDIGKIIGNIYKNPELLGGENE